ncbi:MAG: YigZ family protein [Chitinophagaceae bacterium]|nr:YigZ family protein [Chitinophagaceae bacterium]
MSNTYHTILQPTQSEFRDRGSKFIAYAYPIENVADFKEKLAALKKEHPKAVHHCFAYRIGMDGNVFRVSDDGEPSGSAGRPMLGQIDSLGLTNVLVVVVRYFGGTLLGVPGLINAYKTATLEALQLAGKIEKPVLHFYRLQFDYTILNEVMRVVKQYDCFLRKQDMQLFCLQEIGIPAAVLTEALGKIKELRGMEWEKI